MGHDLSGDGTDLVEIVKEAVQAAGHYLIQICHATIDLILAGDLVRHRLVLSTKLYLGEDDGTECLVLVCQKLIDVLFETCNFIRAVLSEAGFAICVITWGNFVLVLFLSLGVGISWGVSVCDFVLGLNRRFFEVGICCTFFPFF